MSENILEYADDIADAEAPVALPAGDYPATIASAELGTSQNSGKLRVDVTFKIAPEDFPADYEDAASFENGKMVHFYVGAEPDKASRFRMRRFIEAIGAKGGAKIDLNDWVGKKAAITIRPDEFNGVERETIANVQAL